MPKTSDVDTLLVGLLSAQASIAALTLAVTLFVMQGVSTRRDADDRIYGEYIRRSRVRFIFGISIGAVLTTGVVLMVQKVVGDAADLNQAAASARNLTPLVSVSFVANLAFAVMLFERAIQLANPEHWRKLRMDVNERDVRQAVRVYIGRLHRAIASRDADEPDWSIMFPDPGEGSANEAIRALLDDARRAMAERRQQEFERSLNAIRELVTYAMDEMEKADIQWGSPGAQAEWPPLRELGHNLYSFREEVVRNGTRECIFGLKELDFWIVHTGIRRSCGELFATGLYGYRSNYQIAARFGGDELQGMFRDDFSRDLNGLVFGQEPQILVPFIQEIIAHQERMLSDAMHSNRQQDYAQLHEEFRSAFSNVMRHWRIEWSESPEVATLWDRLAQQYHVAIMGLAGRGIALAATGRITDAKPYLDVARETYINLSVLENDITIALLGGRRLGQSQWVDWEMQDHPIGEVVTVETDKYPQAFLAVRIMELIDEATPVLNLHGNAQRILDWFLANSERLERFVQETPSLSVSQRQDLAAEVLRQAVRLDEIEEDHQIIQRALSSERIFEFKAGVRDGARSPDFIERLFQQAGTFRRIAAGADDCPDERVSRSLRPKAYLMEPAENDRTGYMPFDGKEWGRTLAFDVVNLLCEELDEAPQIIIPLDSLTGLLNAIELAVEELAPVDDMFVVIAGDWGNILVGLYTREGEGYIPSQHSSDENTLGEVGRYRGNPIFRGKAVGERRLYVIEPGTWGYFMRAHFDDGQDVRVDIEPISNERAQELLQITPDHFRDQPDYEAKLRKLQTCVGISTSVRHGFEVINPSRARRIASSESSTISND
ncbi:MAG: hypothetical protein OXE87_03380 [Chloroflexi bacterium]|nr:hypothetical protein [Chloroflexota bacterium]